MMLTPRQRILVMSLAAVLVMLALSTLSSAAAVSQVYRLLQAELDGQQMGSAAYAARSFMTLPLPGANTFKAILVVPLSLAAPGILQGHLQSTRSALEGVLLVLPPQYDAGALSAEDAGRLAAVEQLLLTERVKMPFFFTVESPELQQAIDGTRAMFKRGVAPSSTGERFELAIQGSPPSEVKPSQYINYWALLSASEQQAKGAAVAPTVLVTAHYDTFSLAPALPSLGTDSNASGAVALLALLRAFGRLYASADSRPPCNLLFLLTSGGPHGFEGARQWLNDADPEFLDKVSFVLALDSIGRRGAGRPLHLHYVQAGKGGGRKAMAAAGTEWHAALHGAAEGSGVPLADVAGQGSREKEDGAESSVAWAHEHFAARGLAAATLSARAGAYGSVLRGGIADGSSSSSSSSSSNSSSSSSSSGDGSSEAASSSQSSRAVDPAAVLAAAQLAGDALTRLVFPGLEPGLRLVDVDGKGNGKGDGKGDEGTSASQLTFVRSWLALFARSPRTLPLDQHLEGGEALHSAIARFLREHASAYKRHLWERSALPLRVWGGVDGTLHVYRAASVMFDMVLTLGVVVYLAAAFAALRIATRGWGEFEAMFRAEAPRRRGTSSRRA